jgi:DNA-binding transcriptional LysR family regulator
MLKTNQLKYFIAVAEELHFGRAAKRLHLSQPPLSQQIKKFEDELGAQLFTRNKRSVSLTPAGKALLGEAREILSRIEEIKDYIRDVASGMGGTINLGYIGPALDTPLTDIIRDFKLTYPQVKIDLVEMTTNMQLQAIIQQKIDAGIVRLFKHDIRGLHCIKFHQESYALAIPAGHPLTPKKSVRITDLACEELIFFPRSSQPNLYDEWMTIFSSYGFNPVVVQEAATKAASISLVAAGMGVSIVPESTAKRAPEEVLFKKLSGKQPSLEFHIVYKEKSTHPSRDNFISMFGTST